MYIDDLRYLQNKKMETLIEIIRIYSQDIGMEFGNEKGTVLIMKNGKGKR